MVSFNPWLYCPLLVFVVTQNSCADGGRAVVTLTRPPGVKVVDTCAEWAEEPMVSFNPWLYCPLLVFVVTQNSCADGGRAVVTLTRPPGVKVVDTCAEWAEEPMVSFNPWLYCPLLVFVVTQNSCADGGRAVVTLTRPPGVKVVDTCAEWAEEPMAVTEPMVSFNPWLYCPLLVFVVTQNSCADGGRAVVTLTRPPGVKVVDTCAEWAEEPMVSFNPWLYCPLLVFVVTQNSCADGGRAVVTLTRPPGVKVVDTCAEWAEEPMVSFNPWLYCPLLVFVVTQNSCADGGRAVVTLTSPPGVKVVDTCAEWAEEPMVSFNPWLYCPLLVFVVTQNSCADGGRAVVTLTRPPGVKVVDTCAEWAEEPMVSFNPWLYCPLLVFVVTQNSCADGGRAVVTLTRPPGVKVVDTCAEWAEEPMVSFNPWLYCPLLVFVVTQNSCADGGRAVVTLTSPPGVKVVDTCAEWAEEPMVSFNPWLYCPLLVFVVTQNSCADGGRAVVTLTRPPGVKVVDTCAEWAEEPMVSFNPWLYCPLLVFVVTQNSCADGGRAVVTLTRPPGVKVVDTCAEWAEEPMVSFNPWLYCPLLVFVVTQNSCADGGRAVVTLTRPPGVKVVDTCAEWAERCKLETVEPAVTTVLCMEGRRQAFGHPIDESLGLVGQLRENVGL
ncbi:hypothetical protein TGRH88_066510 [Toxoplasma gondii]|uniref:Uncharacterized protein n=1 Tax=Toxoplasma gondii TaxID=5811 RepID=A0A7J6JXC1_TOXGO|nr:hypothetical protein TGRH88_066510 [Toxoplasma gondii]